MYPHLFTRIASTALGLALGGLLVSCLQPADEILEHSGQSKLVFVKEPIDGFDNIAMASNVNEFHQGTDLMLLSPISPTGKLTNLTSQWTRAAANSNEWGAALDPEVSFDGKKILFSMRKAKAKQWRVYEMDADGSNLVELTLPPTGDDVDPAYIDNDHIVFASTRNHVLDEYERREAPQLFIGERGGMGGALQNIRQITFNQSHDQNPFVHSSGMILFARWDHLGDPNKIPLFEVNSDGTRQFVMYGADETFAGVDGMTSGQRAFLEGRELADGGIVSSMMERTSVFEGGAICIIDLSNFTAPPQIITPKSSPYNTGEHTSQGIFKTPYPILDNGRERLLVAQSPLEVGGGMRREAVNYDLYVMDKNGGNLKLIHADAGHNDYDPVVVAPRALPFKPFKLDPNVGEGLASGAKTGFFFDANVYSRMPNDGHMGANPTGTALSGDIKALYVRVLEAVSITTYERNSEAGSLGHTEFEKQRVVGYADVRSDGSFSVEVPANKPLHVQTLDENGMMLVNQFQWINVMPGERRMCTGCHGAREHDGDINHFKIQGDLTVKFDSVKSYFSGFNNPQNVLTHPSARQDTVDFFNLVYKTKTNTVQAALDRQCNSCHGAATALAQGGGVVLENVPQDSLNNKARLSSVYDFLTRQDSYKKGLSYVNDNGARTSPLAWVLFNKQLSGKDTQFVPLRYDHSALWKDTEGRIDVFASKNVDLLTLIEWMDMGIQFSNTNGK